jgi:Fibronectin type III domain
VEIAVWLIAGFFALNAVVLGTSVFMATNGRHRARREIRQLEALWRLGSSTSERHRATKLIVLSAAAALVIAVSAMTIPKLEGPQTSALGPSIPTFVDGGTAATGSREVQANGSTGPSTSLVDLAGGSPSGAADATSGLVPDRGSAGGQGPSTTPAFVAAEPRSSTVIRVSWARVAGATGYGLERSTEAAAGWVRVATTGDQVTAYTDAGLDPEETYFYRVLVILEDGASAPPSDVVSATTPVNPPEATVLQVTSGSQTTIDIAWSDVANESGYRIERSSDGVTEWAAIGTTGQDVTVYSDVGLERHTTYFYRVVATNEGGSAPPSNVVSETTRNGAGTGDVTDVDDADDGEPAGDGDATTPATEPSADEGPAAPVDQVEASGEAAG